MNKDKKNFELCSAIHGFLFLLPKESLSLLLIPALKTSNYISRSFGLFTIISKENLDLIRPNAKCYIVFAFVFTARLDITLKRI